MDPLADSYVSTNPYVYCLGNPVKYIDPEGREIWMIATVDGKEIRREYTPNMGELGIEGIDDIIRWMNFLYAHGVERVINRLCKSSDIYNITNRIPSGGGSGYKPNSSGSGGEIYGGNYFNTDFYNDFTAAISLAHELRHAYQYLLDAGGRTALNEVDAYAFAASISYNSQMAMFGDSKAFRYNLRLKGQNSTEGRSYENAMMRVVIDGETTAIDDAINNFMNGSNANRSGLYDSYITDPSPVSKYLITEILWKIQKPSVQNSLFSAPRLVVPF